jgi:hypothetical protein
MRILNQKLLLLFFLITTHHKRSSKEDSGANLISLSFSFSPHARVRSRVFMENIFFIQQGKTRLLPFGKFAAKLFHFLNNKDFFRDARN